MNNDQTNLAGREAKVELGPGAVILLGTALGVVDSLALDGLVLVDTCVRVVFVLAIGNCLAMVAVVKSVAWEARALAVAQVRIAVPLAFGAGIAHLLVEEILAVKRVVDAEAAVDLGVELAARVELAVLVRVDRALKPVAGVVAQAVLLIKRCKSIIIIIINNNNDAPQSL